MSDDDQMDEVADGRDTEVEEAMKALKDVKEKFNLIRSKHILAEAVHLGGE